MSSGKQESRRKIAERVVITHVNPFTSVDIKALTVAIEAALKERDERAARICEAGAMLASPNGLIPADDPEHERLQRIMAILNKAAAAIRNEEPHA